MNSAELKFATVYVSETAQQVYILNVLIKFIKIKKFVITLEDSKKNIHSMFISKKYIRISFTVFLK